MSKRRPIYSCSILVAFALLIVLFQSGMTTPAQEGKRFGGINQVDSYCQGVPGKGLEPEVTEGGEGEDGICGTRAPRFLDGRKIVIDPGHGYYYDSDLDAWYWQRDLNWGLREDLNNIDLALSLKYYLESRTTAQVFCTRELDPSAGIGESGLAKWKEGSYQYLMDKCSYDPGPVIDVKDDLMIRTHYANELGADIFISLHSNADNDGETGDPATGHSKGSGDWQGFYTIYGTHSDGSSPDPDDKALADALHPALANHISGDMPDRGEAQDIYLSGFQLAVLRYTAMPAVLFEIGFHDNLTDTVLLLNQSFRDRTGLGITEGVLAYYGEGLYGRSVCVDPGHGGTDPGAPGYGGPPNEEDVNLDVGSRLRDLLEGYGAKVYMTRTADTDVGLQERCDVANNNNADIFVSVHCNSFDDQSANGTETYRYTYGSSDSQVLAARIQDKLLEHLGRRDRGVRQADYYVLQHTAMPAALAELMFLSNPDEWALLAQPSTRQDSARALFEAVCLYFGAAVPEDNPPVVHVDWPGEGEVVGGTMRLKVSALDDTGVVRVSAGVDAGSWIVDHSEPFSFLINTEDHSLGPHSISVEAEDVYGNVNTTTVEVNFQRNLALARHAGDAYGEGDPERIIDDIDSLNNYGYTTWNTTDPGNLTVCLPQAYNVSHVKLHLWDGDSRYLQYKLEYSLDNQTWETLSDNTSGQWSSWETVDRGQSPVLAKYVRFNGTYNSVNDWCHVIEMQVFSRGLEILDNYSDNRPFAHQTQDATLWLLWERDFGNYSQIWCKKSLDGGSTWATPAYVTNDTDRYYSYPSLAESKDGASLTMVYQREVNGTDSIFSRVSSDNGMSWGEERPVIDNGFDNRHPRIHRTFYGTLWVVYSSDIGGQRNVYYAYSVDNGATWQHHTKISTNTGSHVQPFNNQLSQSEGNMLWTMWSSDQDGDQDVYYAKSTTWDDWSSRGRVSDQQGDETDTSFTAFQNGTMAALWVRNETIYASMSGNEGGNWTSPLVLTRGRDPAAITLHGGETLVFWTKDIRGRSEISMTRDMFSLLGTPAECTLISPKDGSVITNTSVELKWQGTDVDDDPIEYDVYVSNSTVFDQPLASNIGANSYQVDGLSNGTDYYWKVVPKTYEGPGICINGLWTFYVEVDPRNSPPTVPSNLSIDNRHNPRPMITWSPSQDEDGEDIVYQLRLNKSGQEQDLLSSDVEKTYVIVPTQLEFHTEYFVALRARDGRGGLSSWINTSFELENFGPEITLLAPSNGSNISSMAPVLRWFAEDPENDELEFKVYLSENESAASQVEANLTSAKYSLMNLTNGTTYYWKIFVSDFYGMNTSSPVWCFTVDLTLNNSPPRAVISDHMNAYVRDRVGFDASNCYDPDGHIVTYMWDFGDGANASGMIAFHSYRSHGMYNASLLLVDDGGACLKVNITVNIFEDGDNLPPTALIYAPLSSKEIRVGDVLAFYAYLSYDPDGTIVEYEWDFGDGEGANTSLARHSFRNIGRYNVTLTVIDDKGASSRDTMAIDVEVMGWLTERFEFETGYLDMEYLAPASVAIGLDEYKGKEAVLGPVVNISAPNLKWRTAYLYTDVSSLAVPEGMNTSFARIRDLDHSGNIAENDFYTGSMSGWAVLSDLGRYAVVCNYNPIPRIIAADCNCVIEENGTINMTEGSMLRLTAFLSSDPEGGFITNYSWSFMGDRIDGIDFNHRFKKPGNFTVDLWVEDDMGALNRTHVRVRVSASEAPPSNTEEEREEREGAENEGIIFVAGCSITVIILVILAVLLMLARRSGGEGDDGKGSDEGMGQEDGKEEFEVKEKRAVDTDQPNGEDEEKEGGIGGPDDEGGDEKAGQKQAAKLMPGTQGENNTGLNRGEDKWNGEI